MHICIIYLGSDRAEKGEKNVLNNNIYKVFQVFATVLGN